MSILIGIASFKPNGRRAKYFQLPDKNTLPAVTLKISPEQNIESTSPPDQHKRDTDSVIPEGWKLEKEACFGWDGCIFGTFVI